MVAAVEVPFFSREGICRLMLQVESVWFGVLFRRPEIVKVLGDIMW